MKIKGIYLFENGISPDSDIEIEPNTPLKYGNKVVGKIVSCKLIDGKINWEAIITDENIKQKMLKDCKFSIKILGE